MLDTLIIGSGPAGLSAAIYTSRAGLATTILTGDTQGGLVTTTEKVDNYLGLYGAEGTEMAENFLEHAVKFGANIESGTVESIHVQDNGNFYTRTTDGTVIESTAVIYAAGSTPRKLSNIDENINGISYCATCDGMFFEDEEVAIVGGGETAAEDALYLAQLCKKVTVLVRGKEWRATEPAVQKLVDQDNVTILMNTIVESAVTNNGDLTKITLSNGDFLDITGLFVAIGQQPNSSVAQKHVNIFDDGFIDKSVVPGFFVAGDISNPEYRQVIIAAGDGAKAGIDATRYILNK